MQADWASAAYMLCRKNKNAARRDPPGCEYYKIYFTWEVDRSCTSW